MIIIGFNEASIKLKYDSFFSTQYILWYRPNKGFHTGNSYPYSFLNNLSGVTTNTTDVPEHFMIVILAGLIL
jgi:hypothetical protein